MGLVEDGVGAHRNRYHKVFQLQLLDRSKSELWLLLTFVPVDPTSCWGHLDVQGFFSFSLIQVSGCVKDFSISLVNVVSVLPGVACLVSASSLQADLCSFILMDNLLTVSPI